MTDRSIQGFRLSPQQERLWLLQREDGCRPYLVQAMARLPGPIDADVLETAIRQMSGRHEILRTTFRTLPGMVLPLQVIAENGAPGMEVHDFGGFDPRERELELDALFAEMGGQGLDPEQGPLCRIGLVRLSPTEHALILVLSALCGDRMTLFNFFAELNRVYDGCLIGEPLTEEGLPYVAVVEWQHDLLQSEEAVAGREHWRECGALDIGAAVIPHERLDPDNQSFSPRALTHPLSPDLFSGAEAIAAENGASPVVFFLTCWLVLIGRMTGSRRALAGTAYSGRSDEELHALLGLLEKYLPIQVSWDKGTAFTDLLHRVAEADRQAEMWQECFTWGSEADPALSRLPFFPFCFDFQDRFPCDPGWSPRRLYSCGERFKARLSFLTEGESLRSTIYYDENVLTKSAAELLWRQYLALLESAILHSHDPVDGLSLLDARSRNQLLFELNDTARGPHEYSCIHRYLEKWAARNPDGIALVWDNGGNLDEVVYRDLNRRANRMAVWLSRSGIGPEDRVGLCLEPSAEMVIGLLAVWKAGGAYVPLDPALPESRLALLVRDAGISLALAQPKWLGVFSRIGIRALSPWEEHDLIARQPGEDRDAVVEPHRLAYVLYTSGSTGQPKGVMIAHQSVVNHMMWMNRVFGFGPGDRILQKAPLTFDASVWELCAPLVSGARLVVARAFGFRDPEYLVSLIERSGANVLQMVPSLLVAMLDGGFFQELPALRYLFCAGEVLTVRAQQRVFELGSVENVCNMYGPTEATIDVTWWQTREARTLRAVPIGKPLDNARTYILDRLGVPVPIGIRGELFLAGLPLARGYLNDPDTTAVKFIPNGFAEAPGSRLYATGDLARYLPDGNIEFLGRRDHQLKLHGIRIEPGEIEAVAELHSGVARAAVLKREGRAGHARLVAFLAPAKDREDNRYPEHADGVPEPSGNVLHQKRPAPARLARDVEELLRNRLPKELIPDQIVVLDALPLTASGKLDRQALATRDIPDPDGARFHPPQTPSEKALAGIWAEVLERERIGLHDNFFSLGGDSIISLQVVGKARQLGYRFTVAQLFAHPTIAALAEVVETAPGADFASGPVIGTVPLLPIARAFFERTSVDVHHFNQALLLEIREPISPRVCRAAVEALIRHHDALRLRFSERDGSWTQRVVPWDPEMDSNHFLLIDLSAIPENMRAQTQISAAERVQASLNLAEGPLARFVFFDWGPAQAARLMIVIHHLAVDGFSWRILLEDLSLAWRGLSQGRPVAFPPGTSSLKHWADSLLRHAQSEPAIGALDYWRDLAHRPIVPLPADFPGKGIAAIGSAEDVSVSLEPEKTRVMFQEVPAAYHTEINDLLLAALALAFADRTGERSLMVTLEGHGREPLFEDIDLTRTVGWFTAEFPVLLTVSDHPGEALKAIKEQLRRIPNHGIDFGVLRYLSEDPEVRNLCRRIPVPEVGFNYLGRFDQTLPEESPFALGTEPIGSSASDRHHCLPLLDLNAMVVGGQFRVRFRYSTERFRRETVLAIANNFLEKLRLLIDHCCTPGVGGPTPSDVPDVSLTQRELDTIVATLGDKHAIEAIYPPTPLQVSTLFASSLRPESGVYVGMLACELSGDLDVDAFQSAWKAIMERHDVFRTVFLDIAGEKPLQIVCGKVSLPFRREDWRGLSPDEQEARFDTVIREERRRGFHPSVVPLTGFLLIRTGNRAYKFLWSHHHALLDGWSMAIVLREVAECYRALAAGQSMNWAPAPLYRDYVRWLNRQDMGRAEQFWREQLRGFDEPTPLPFDRRLETRVSGDVMPHTRVIVLTKSLSAALQELVQREGLTMNIVCLGAWAMTLSRFSQKRDVLFGTVVSGRPVELPRVTSMVGPFVNTLPVRVALPDGIGVSHWLKALYRDQANRELHCHTPLSAIRGWASISGDRALFDSMFQFQSYPFAAISTGEGNGNFEIKAVRTLEQNNFSLTIEAIPGKVLTLRASYDPQRFEKLTIDRLMAHFRSFLELSAAEPEATLGGLEDSLAIADRQWRNGKQAEFQRTRRKRFTRSR